MSYTLQAIVGTRETLDAASSEFLVTIEITDSLKWLRSHLTYGSAMTFRPYRLPTKDQRLSCNPLLHFVGTSLGTGSSRTSRQNSGVVAVSRRMLCSRMVFRSAHL